MLCGSPVVLWISTDVPLKCQYLPTALQSHPIILMFLSVLLICKQLIAPIFRKVCPVHFPEDGGSKLLLEMHDSNSYFVCSQIGRTQGQLRMFSHCRGYVQGPTKSGAFRDSAHSDLHISTATHTVK
jgi:hypothetical protein